MSDKLLPQHLRLFNPSLPVASLSTAKNPDLPVKFSTRVIPVFLLNQQCLSTQQQPQQLGLRPARPRIRSNGDRVSPAKKGRVSDAGGYGMSSRQMGRVSFGAFSSGKARFGAQLEGENAGFVSHRRENGRRGEGKDLKMAKRGERGSELGYGRGLGGGIGGRRRDRVGGRGARGGGGSRGLKKGGKSFGRGGFGTWDEGIGNDDVRGSELGYGEGRGGDSGGGDQVGGRGGHGGGGGGVGHGGSGGGGGLKKGGESSGRGGFVSSDEETGDDDDDEEEEEEGIEKLMKSFRHLISEEDSEEDDGDGMLENGGSLFANKEASPLVVSSSSGSSDSSSNETRFDQCSVCPLSLMGIEDAGCEKMTVVQEATLPVILEGEDVLAKAKTGTGKTVAFLILEATPGRLRHHIENTAGFATRLMGVKVLVLDEADHLLDMGLRKDIEKIKASIPKQRQTLLFSASVLEEVRQICHIALKRDHEFIDTIGEGSEETHSQVRQIRIVAPLDKHFSLLYILLKEHISDDVDYKVLVFCTTTMVTRFVVDLLGELNLNVREIHSRTPQGYRTKVYDEFRKSKGLILVTSNVSSHGVDYPDVTLVIQVSLPADREQYIHRLGRTSCKGKEGQGVLLLAPSKEFFLSAIKDLPITETQVPLVDPETRKKVERSLSRVEMKNKEAAYQAWLGYCNFNKNAGRDKYRLVELANEFSRSMGLDNPPAIPKLVLGKMALKKIPEVNFALDRLVIGLPQLSTSEKGNSVTVSYDSWLLKHPSALDTFQQMMSIAKGRKIVVFLDYDGTLSNIVDDPEKAFMTNKMRMTVREVAHYFPTAIISGRSRDKVYDFVELDNVYYAGSHGLDIAAPLQSPKYGDPKHQTRVVYRKGNEVVLFQPAKKYLPAIQKIFSALIEKTRSIRGVMIENNKFCISVHFRHVHDEDFCILEKLVNSVMGEYKEFRISMGLKVFEIRPDIEWDKGHALNYLLDTLGFGSTSDVLPLYIGDDRTDEDAFKAIRNRGEGFPIAVYPIPKDTMALYTLRNPLEVQKFLLRLVRWKKHASTGKFIV